MPLFFVHSTPPLSWSLSGAMESEALLPAPTLTGFVGYGKRLSLAFSDLKRDHSQPALHVVLPIRMAETERTLSHVAQVVVLPELCPWRVGKLASSAALE